MNKKRTFDAEGDADVEVALKSKKPLPLGYVCNACGMENDHAIYNCPSKVSKKQRTTQSSLAAAVSAEKVPQEQKFDDNTVFISGLPFDTDKKSLTKFFNDNSCCTDEIPEKHIRLVMFDDNPKKCKGLAYIKLLTDEQMKAFMTLDGLVFGKKSLKVEKYDSSVKERKQAQQRKDKNQIKRCYRCGKNHDASTCTNARVCYKCLSTEHLSKDCPRRSKTES